MRLGAAADSGDQPLNGEPNERAGGRIAITTWSLNAIPSKSLTTGALWPNSGPFAVSSLRMGSSIGIVEADQRLVAVSGLTPAGRRPREVPETMAGMSGGGARAAFWPPTHRLGGQALELLPIQPEPHDSLVLHRSRRAEGCSHGSAGPPACRVAQAVTKRQPSTEQAF